MGVDEEANLVKDDFNRTKRLLNDIGIFVIIPAILNLNKVSLVMGKNVAEALDVDYHVAVYIGVKYLFFSPPVPSKREKDIPYARQYKPRLVYFFTPCPKTIYVL